MSDGYAGAPTTFAGQSRSVADDVGVEPRLYRAERARVLAGEDPSTLERLREHVGFGHGLVDDPGSRRVDPAVAAAGQHRLVGHPPREPGGDQPAQAGRERDREVDLR